MSFTTRMFCTCLLLLLCLYKTYAESAPDLIITIGGDDSPAGAYHHDPLAESNWINVQHGDAMASCQEGSFGHDLPPVPSNKLRIRILNAGKLLVSNRKASERADMSITLRTESHNIPAERLETGYPLTQLYTSIKPVRSDLILSTAVKSTELTADKKSVSREHGLINKQISADKLNTRETVGTSGSENKAEKDITTKQTAVSSIRETAEKEATTRKTSVSSYEKSASIDTAQQISRSVSKEEQSGKKELTTSDVSLTSTIRESKVEKEQQELATFTKTATSQKDSQRSSLQLEDSMAEAVIESSSASINVITAGLVPEKESGVEILNYPFKLNIKADRYEVYPGEIILITATFENISHHKVINPQIAISLPRSLQLVDYETVRPVLLSKTSGKQRTELIEWSITGTYPPGATETVWLKVKCGLKREMAHNSYSYSR